MFSEVLEVISEDLVAAVRLSGICEWDGINEDEYHPDEFELNPVFPNPFNSSTTITYSLPTLSKVTLRIYNTKGQLIEALEDRVIPAGNHNVVWDAEKTGAGLYFINLAGSEQTLTRKIILVK